MRRYLAAGTETVPGISVSTEAPWLSSHVFFPTHEESTLTTNSEPIYSDDAPSGVLNLARCREKGCHSPVVPPSPPLSFPPAHFVTLTREGSCREPVHQLFLFISPRPSCRMAGQFLTDRATSGCLPIWTESTRDVAGYSVPRTGGWTRQKYCAAAHLTVTEAHSQFHPAWRPCRFGKCLAALRIAAVPNAISCGRVHDQGPT